MKTKKEEKNANEKLFSYGVKRSKRNILFVFRHTHTHTHTQRKEKIVIIIAVHACTDQNGVRRCVCVSCARSLYHIHIHIARIQPSVRQRHELSFAPRSEHHHFPHSVWQRRSSSQAYYYSLSFSFMSSLNTIKPNGFT